MSTKKYQYGEREREREISLLSREHLIFDKANSNQPCKPLLLEGFACFLKYHSRQKTFTMFQ